MKEAREFRVMITGLGGQGALLFGQLLAEAGMSRYKYVSYFPHYATIMRGGESECTVTLSDEEIDSPAVLRPEAAIVMASPRLKQFEERVQPGGMLMVDSSVVKDKVGREDVRVFSVPATQIAHDLGEGRVANLVLLGAYLEITRAVPLELVEEVLERKLKGGKGEALLPLNKRALREGARAIAACRE